MNKLSVVRRIAKNRLALVGIDERDADYILHHTLNIPITELALTDIELNRRQYKRAVKYVKMRCKHKPISEIFKKSYFYGLEFCVNKHVLSPRFDTEILVDTSLEYIKLNNRVLDLCTGSGCIATSIAKNVEAYVEACDISKKALKVARKNIKINKANVDLYQSNMFDKVQGKFNVIVSNPPYIETKTILTLDDEVKCYDPVLALDGGLDGLDFYREIALRVKDYLLEGGVLIMEIGYNQGESVKDIFKSISSNIEIIKDYNNNDRVVVVNN